MLFEELHLHPLCLLQNKMIKLITHVMKLYQMEDIQILGVMLMKLNLTFDDNKKGTEVCS